MKEPKVGDTIPSPLSEEIEVLRKELKLEQGKIICGDCRGAGEFTAHGPIHSATWSCSKCGGSGFLY